MMFAKLLKATVVVVSITAVACKDSTGPSSSTLDLTISASGADIDRDADGYLLRVDADSARAIPANRVTTQFVLPLGNHVLKLEGLEPNCSVTGTNERTVEVVAGQVASVSFVVACAPNTGTVRIVTSTSGAYEDGHRYAIDLPGMGRVDLPANGAVSFSGIRKGQLSLTLKDAAANCTVSTNPQIVQVAYNGSVDAPFNIACVAPGGLDITTVTSGVDADNDGYAVQVSRTGAQAITLLVASNGTRSVSPLMPGEYSVSISGVLVNCQVITPRPLVVTVPAGANTPVRLNVTCAATEKLAIVAGTNGSEEIWVVNANGASESRLTNAAGPSLDPAWSPNATLIAFTSLRDRNSEIYLMNQDGTNQVRLTNIASSDYRPAWSPDGNRIAFVSTRADGFPDVYLMNADGSDPARLTDMPGYVNGPDWSPDGKRIVFALTATGDSSGLWVIDIDGSHLSQLTSNPAGDSQPVWSPDGTKIAFSRGSPSQVATLASINADGSEMKQFSVGGSATDPSWSQDGTKIAFTLNSVNCYDYYYYYYDCDSYIGVVSTDGVFYSLATPTPASNPAWRR